MELVINIPEEWYGSIMNGNSDALNAEFVKRGIVLPEGHGRLIDADELCRNISEFKYLNSKDKTIESIMSMVKCMVDLETTIVQSDKKEMIK